MFLIDEKTNQLHADIFDEGKCDDKGKDIYLKGKEIRYQKTPNVFALHVW